MTDSVESMSKLKLLWSNNGIPDVRPLTNRDQLPPERLTEESEGPLLIASSLHHIYASDLPLSASSPLPKLVHILAASSRITYSIMEGQVKNTKKCSNGGTSSH